MTKQIINIGTSANKGNGDPLRTAFAKVNANFDELYTALGLNADGTLSLGAFEFTGSVMTTTDSTAIIIDQATTVTSNLTVGGDILPSLANGGNLGSLAAPWNSLYVSNSTIYFGGIPLSVDVNGNLLVNNQPVTGSGGSSVTTGATAPVDPGVGDLWYDTASGRTYVYYDSSWVDANPVDGTGSTIPTQSTHEGKFLRTDGTNLSWVAITTPTQLVNGNKTVSLGTEGKLTLPAGTTYEYLSVPLTGHGDGLAVLDFALVTDGVDAQWIASSPNPEGVGYSVGDTFTFDETFLGIPGASTTIEVLTIGSGGSIVEIGFSPAPLYPADIYRDSPINLQVGTESNRWTFGHTGTLTTPGDIQLGADSYLRFPDSSFQGTAFVGDASRLYGNVDQDVDIIARPPSTVTATTTFDTDPLTGQFELSEPFDIYAVQAGWEMNTGTEQSPIWSTVSNASLNPGEYWIYLVADADFLFAPNTAYTFRNPTPVLRTWTFGTDGALTFPDNLTVVNGIIGKASTATITEGEASQTTAIESQIEITTTGVVIAKRTSVTVNDGVTTTVNDNGSTLELDNTHASITYYIEPDGPDNNSLIQFTTDSSAGGGATIETVTEDVGGTAHGRVRAAGNSVQVSAKTFLGTNKTWSFTGAGDLQLPESGNILSNGANYIDLANFETSYNDAEGAYQDALTAWMTLETFRPVWFALPGRLAYDEMIAWTPTTGQPALPLNLPPVAKNAQDSYAAWQETIALSKLTVASDIAEFDFNSTGKLRLPQGGTVGGGDQAAIDTAYDGWQADEAAWQNLITTDGADLNVRPWNFAGPSRAEKQAVVLSMWQAQQSGAAIDWVPISSTFYNQVNAWLAITANQDGYDEWKKLTTTVNITSEDKTWTFTNDGALTLPDASVIASYKPVTVIAATTTAQTITDNASAAFIQFVDTVDTASAYSTGTFTAPYTGYYQINMSVYFSTTVSLTSTSFLLIDTNLDFTKQVRIIDGNWTGSYLHYSTVISATAGDAIRVAFRQVSGGDVEVSSGSRLTIHRVSIS